MLNRWLDCRGRTPCPYSHFEVIDIEAANDLSSAVRTHLIDLLRSERHSREYLRAMTERLGWQKVRDLIIKRQIPVSITIKRGRFGEVLISAILEQFHSYIIPVRKIRFSITGDQSLPATDAVALKTDARGSIIEVCFVESKLRTRTLEVDCSVAANGCEQLATDYMNRLPDILDFVAQRLHERKDPLFDTFASYMGSRSDTTDMDTFRLGLCWERTEWNESVLENLEEAGPGLPQLTVHVICINNLRQLTDELFADLGITEVLDDD